MNSKKLVALLIVLMGVFLILLYPRAKNMLELRNQKIRDIKSFQEMDKINRARQVAICIESGGKPQYLSSGITCEGCGFSTYFYCDCPTKEKNKIEDSLLNSKESLNQVKCLPEN